MTEPRPAPAGNWNQRIIEEFRANGGTVGGPFEGALLVLLTTAGARTRRPHTNPATYLRDGDRILVFASNAGQPRNPDWYHNLLANPRVTVEIGAAAGTIETYAARAVPLDGAERDRFYRLQARLVPAFAGYETMTSRRIPVIALHRLDLAADPERNRALGRQLLRVHDELRRELAGLRSRVDEIGTGPDGRPGEDRTPADPFASAGDDRAPADPGVPGGSEPGVPGGPGAELARHCLAFCDALTMHHTSENGAFTAFDAQFPDLAPALDRLRREHRLVAGALTELRTLVGEPTPAAGLRTRLDRLATELEKHFAYEERQLLPALGLAVADGRAR